MHEKFVAIGGMPETEHPLSFVIEGSKHLEEWFENGIESRIPISGIDKKHNSNYSEFHSQNCLFKQTIFQFLHGPE